MPSKESTLDVKNKADRKFWEKCTYMISLGRPAWGCWVGLMLVGSLGDIERCVECWGGRTTFLPAIGHLRFAPQFSFLQISGFGCLWQLLYMPFELCPTDRFQKWNTETRVIPWEKKWIASVMGCQSLLHTWDRSAVPGAWWHAQCSGPCQMSYRAFLFMFYSLIGGR